MKDAVLERTMKPTSFLLKDLCLNFPNLSCHKESIKSKTALIFSTSTRKTKMVMTKGLLFLCFPCHAFFPKTYNSFQKPSHRKNKCENCEKNSFFKRDIKDYKTNHTILKEKAWSLFKRLYTFLTSRGRIHRLFEYNIKGTRFG